MLGHFINWWRSLNLPQQIVIVIACLFALAAIIYPTWREVYTNEAGAFDLIDHGRHFIWEQPAEIEGRPSQGVKVNTSERSATLVGIAIVTLILFFILKQKSQQHSRQDSDNLKF